MFDALCVRRQARLLFFIFRFQDSALRKSQDLQLVHQVLLVWTCIDQIKANRSTFLSDTAEMNSISQEDMEAVDKM